MGASGYQLSSKTMPKLAYIWAISSGIDDEGVEISVAAVKEVDISYSFLAGLSRTMMRQQRLQSTWQLGQRGAFIHLIVLQIYRAIMFAYGFAGVLIGRSYHSEFRVGNLNTV
jgi:hypothetical protein